MPHVNSLPPETQRVLRRLGQRTDLEGFKLIGGTALAIRHGHRESEDLDLAWTGGDLPLGRIRRIIEELPENGPAINLIPDIQRQLAEDEGLYLASQQQDWDVDGVKVTFYAQPPRNATIIDADAAPDRIGNLQFVSDDTLFKLKSVVLLDRTASRDLFDLWWFTSHQGRGIGEILANMRAHDRHLSVDTHLEKLAPSSLPLRDPGFKTELAEAPRDKNELLARMREIVDGHRREIARRAAIQAHIERSGGLGPLTRVPPGNPAHACWR